MGGAFGLVHFVHPVHRVHGVFGPPELPHAGAPVDHLSGRLKAGYSVLNPSITHSSSFVTELTTPSSFSGSTSKV